MERKKTEIVSSACPDCGSKATIQDFNRGDIICSECGAVIEDSIIDDGPEWRAFNSAERNKRARVGSPTTYTVHDKGLSTQIDWADRDAHGNKLSGAQRQKMHRLRKWHTRSRVHSPVDRNLAHAMSELDRLSSQLGLPRSVKETSSVIYRQAIMKKLIRGRSIEAMVAASAYAAARQRRVPRTLDEIAKNSRVSKKELGRCYRLMIHELSLKIPLANSTDYIVRFAADLKLTGTTARKAIDLVNDAKQNGLTAGKDPTGLAAAAIYISGIIEGERRTQREIAETATVTEVTVRNRYKELVRKLEISINL
ncbi:MAG: transcription initiation factor IIB [Candidatus Heimdallarchaeota archaeon]|nr:transcription initiation factor IIB [Candidatus Heimdallarchaeota archaeon]